MTVEMKRCDLCGCDMADQPQSDEMSFKGKYGGWTLVDYKDVHNRRADICYGCQSKLNNLFANMRENTQGVLG